MQSAWGGGIVELIDPDRLLLLSLVLVLVLVLVLAGILILIPDTEVGREPSIGKGF